MFVFRFKITFENNNSFLREIALPSDQTFEDFHNIMVENLKLDEKKGASFYLCDHKFRKRREIALFEKHTDKDTADWSERENADSEEQKQSTLLMKDCRLSDEIEDPHQRLVYLYDLQNRWTLYIELLKIIDVQNQSEYPKIVKQSGGIPRELQPPKAEPSADEDVDDTQPQNMYDSEEQQYPESLDDSELSVKDSDNSTDDNFFDEDDDSKDN